MAAECGCGAGALCPCGELGGGAVYEWAKQNLGRYYLPIITGIVALLLVVAIGYGLGLRNVHDNGAGTQPIGQQLEQAGTNISNATAGIEQAENHAGNIEAGIGNAQESTEYLQGTVSTSAELIGQSKSIIEGIRRRGAQDASTH